MDVARGELKPGETHPAAYLANEWLQQQTLAELMQWQEAFASSAIEGNRSAEVFSETLDRFLNGKPLSDRYLLGLAWALRYGQEGKDEKA